MDLNEIQYLVGDILLTSSESIGRNFNIPLSKRLEVLRQENKLTFTSAELKQKLSIVNKHVCFGWSGSLVEAEEFHAELSNAFCSSNIHHDLTCFFKRTPASNYPNLNVILHVMDSTYINDKFHVKISKHVYGKNIFEGLSSQFGCVAATGSGISDFVKVLNSAPEIIKFDTPELNSDDLKCFDSLGKAFLLCGNLASREYLLGENLKNRWGGWYEFITPFGEFSKISNYINLFWDVDLRGDRPTAALIPTFIKCDYRDDFLILQTLQLPTVNKQGQNNSPYAIHIIPPLGKEPGDYCLVKDNSKICFDHNFIMNHVYIKKENSTDLITLFKKPPLNEKLVVLNNNSDGFSFAVKSTLVKEILENSQRR